MLADNPAREQAKRDAQRTIDAASQAFAHGEITDTEWGERMTQALAAAYLREADPRWQSGFDGDAALWREARELILHPVTRSGSFLDVGCANGHLMESLAAWASERGIELAMYGLELNGELAAVARHRLPAWRDRIVEGNVLNWVPRQRFTYVHVGLENAPPGSEGRLVARLVAEFLEANRRLIAGPVSGDQLAATCAAFQAGGVGRERLSEATDRNGKTRYVVWCENGGT